MSLENYLNNLVEAGLLKTENIGLDQIKALLASAEKNLSAAKKNLAIDEETCYTMAYLAMLKIARALIFLQGFRPDDGQQHKTTIEAAGRILGREFSDLIDRFDIMRRKRNDFTYNPLVPVSQTEANGALANAAEFFQKVKGFITQKIPQRRLFD